MIDRPQPQARFARLPLIVFGLAVALSMVGFTACAGATASEAKDGAATTPLQWLGIISGYGILILILGFGGVVLLRMATNKIDLSKLLCEADGKASLSRFQLLIFTFVVAAGLFLIIVLSSPPRFPTVPTEILTLLGISASTYAVSKGIQKSSSGTNG